MPWLNFAGPAVVRTTEEIYLTEVQGHRDNIQLQAMVSKPKQDKLNKSSKSRVPNFPFGLKASNREVSLI